MNIFTILGIIAALGLSSLHQAEASQGLLDCSGDKIKFEAWFDGTSPSPSSLYIYEIDPSFGVPSNYSMKDFSWTPEHLSFRLQPTVPNQPVLYFELPPDHINGGFSGVLIVDQTGLPRLFYPNNVCEFK